MNPIRYHPLIDADTSETEKTPLFAVEDRKTIREHHSLWLEEISPANYWLISKEPMKKEAAEKTPDSLSDLRQDHGVGLYPS